MRRSKFFLAGLLAAIAAGVVAQTSTIGGSTARPRLTALGIGAPAGSAGTITAVGTAQNPATFTTNFAGTVTALVDNNDTGNSAARFSLEGGDASFSIFTAGSGRSSAIVTGGPIGQQAVLRTLGSYPIIFGTNNTYGAQMDSSQRWIFETTSPQINLVETGVAANNDTWLWQVDAEQMRWRVCNSVGTACNTFLSADRTGNVADSVDVTATAMTLNGASVATTINGTFSGNFTAACTTTPSSNWTYTKTGNVVVLQLDSNVSCTSDTAATILDAGSLPAAIRPASTKCLWWGGVSNGGVSDQATVSVLANGSMNFQQGGMGVGCGGSGWTASGAKVLQGGTTITYLVQ